MKVSNCKDMRDMHMLNKNRFKINKFKRRFGSASIMAIMVLTLLTLSCMSLQKRLIDYGKSEWIDVQSENLLRKSEGAMIITQEKIVEATQRLYDISPYRDDFKNRIESFEYRKQYVSEIESLSDVNMENVKIDVKKDDISEDGSSLYKFWVNVTAYENEYNMKRNLELCVTMKNLRKDRPIKEDNENNIEQGNGSAPNESPDGNVEEQLPEIEPEEDIVENINARDALIFRVVRE